MNEVTRILSAVGQGDPHAAARLLPLVYDELRKLAAHRLASEKPGQTLQATALVHEAYLRLVDREEPQHWNGRGHFFAAAAEAMRRILIEAARRKHRLKAGGGNLHRVDLEGILHVGGPDATDLLTLDEALRDLEREEPRKASVVKLRFFAGLTNDEAAEALGVSSATAENDWAYARAWLKLRVGSLGG
jgi:RNA polymerase sigma factor (TIGR02999 family)